MINTQEEDLLANKLKRARASDFVRHHHIGEYELDFFWPEQRLVVEVGFFDKSHDSAKELWLRNQGYRVCHFSNGQVASHVNKTVARIKELLALGGYETGQHPSTRVPAKKRQAMSWD